MAAAFVMSTEEFPTLGGIQSRKKSQKEKGIKKVHKEKENAGQQKDDKKLESQPLDLTVLKPWKELALRVGPPPGLGAPPDLILAAEESPSSMEDAFAARLRQAWEKEEDLFGKRMMDAPSELTADMCQPEQCNVFASVIHDEGASIAAGYVWEGTQDEISVKLSAVNKSQLSPGTCSTSASEPYMSPSWMSFSRSDDDDLDFSLPACALGHVECTD
jgi:hypothetical protein